MLDLTNPEVAAWMEAQIGRVISDNQLEMFRLDMNDAGQAPFRGEPLTIEGKTLVMHRYDANIIFRRAKP